MNSSEPKIILERRHGRNALGCGMVLIIIGFLVCIAIEPSSFGPILGFFGGFAVFFVCWPQTSFPAFLSGRTFLELSK